MGRVRPASATFKAIEAIEAEVLLKVWDVLHPRVVGGGEEGSPWHHLNFHKFCNKF